MISNLVCRIRSFCMSRPLHSFMLSCFFLRDMRSVGLSIDGDRAIYFDRSCSITGRPAESASATFDFHAGHISGSR